MSHFKDGNAGYQGNNVKSPIFTRNAQRKLLHSTESRCYCLKFRQDIPPEVYTGEIIVVNGTTSIDIELVDAVTGDLVTDGPEALKVEIVVLNGDFDPSRDWTGDQFNIKIVGGRGRSSMFGKDLYLNLQGGIGSIDGIKLKHRSQWKQKIKLRLGARVVDLPDTVKVREAVTGLFLVKDKRLLRSSKRETPSPSDEVWRLKHIGKNGPFHKKLFANHVRTVGDFLAEFYKDAARLRGILGPTMVDHMWNAALTHAQRCKRDDRQSLYPLETCQEIAMVNHLDSFTNKPKNQQEPSFPPVSLDYSQEDSFQKLMEYYSTDKDVIFEDPKQVPYAYPQSTPNNLLLDEDIPEHINELLLNEEPGKSCIVHSNEYKDHIINSSSPEVTKLSLDSKSWQQCVIPGNVCYAFYNDESSNDNQQRGVNKFVLLHPDATVYKGYGKGKNRWTLLLIILKWFSISRNVKIENRITKRIRLS